MNDKIEIVDMRLIETFVEGKRGLRIKVDWDNDRHQVVVLRIPYDSKAVISSLQRLLSLLEQERSLNNI